jgi:hypothetical protein
MAIIDQVLQISSFRLYWASLPHIHTSLPSIRWKAFIFLYFHSRRLAHILELTIARKCELALSCGMTKTL